MHCILLNLNTVLQCLLYIEFLTSSGLLLHSVVSLSELEPVTLDGDLCLLDHIEVRYTMMAGYRHRYSIDAKYIYNGNLFK